MNPLSGAGSQTTNYTLDLNAGLTQVLSDGDHIYLYGLSRIAQLNTASPNTEYFLTDALGSVRQLADASGEITLYRAYTPYGETPMEITQSPNVAITPYGFTGEWTDATGLVYLRARYYSPWQGRFLSRDGWEGEAVRPLSYNRWAYVEGNPVNRVDPTGFFSVDRNERDLTSWLYRELVANAWSSYTLQIHALMSTNNLLEVAKALLAFKYLVQDKAKWDFKHRIKQELQAESLVLFHGTGPFDYRWYEYSVPGNVHYGFVGRAAGIPAWMLHGGASYAEIVDPAHSESGEACCICLPNNKGSCLINTCGYVNWGWASTWFDDPRDFNAVEAGILMYESYGRFLPFEGFQHVLRIYGVSFSPSQEHLEWVWENETGVWPYEVGHFNGPKAQEYEPMIQSLLWGG